MLLLTQFSQAIAGLVPLIGDAAFPATLVRALQALVDADDGSALHYSEGHLPRIAFTQPVAALGQTTLDAYLNGPFLLDPYYRAGAYDHRFGVFRLSELAPHGFKESEYYRSWYRNCGYQDECGLLIDLGEGDFLNIALGLTGRGKRFGKRQAQILEATFAAIEALCRQHWRQIDSTPTKVGLREQLHTSLSAFGSSVLTRRERQVTELVLLGNSTRIIAEKLAISTETVKLHRKHAYAKLDVSSQAELFYLFMEALANSPDGGATDPLVAYHSKPRAP